MKTETTVRQSGTGLRQLTHAEIERRIELVLARVTRPAGLVDDREESGDLAPRWISTAEFVRRMKPFLVYN
jgi:hypothetical protein